MELARLAHAVGPLGSRLPIKSILLGLILFFPVAEAKRAESGDWGATQRAVSSQPETTPIHFAAIGDFGMAGPAEEAVANLVKSGQPDFIITVGDNNYPRGAAETIDVNI